MKYLNPKKISIVTTIVFICSLIPLVVIGFYNCPAADDYAIGLEAHRAFESTGSIFAALGAALKHTWDYYFHWEGNFVGCFFMALPPVAFSFDLYWITCPLILGTFSFSVIFLVRQIFIKIVKADKHIANSIAMITAFMSVQMLPSYARSEAFYWYAGAMNFVFIEALGFIYLGLMIQMFYDTRDGKKIAPKAVLACALGFLAGGGNQMSALNMVLILITVIFLLGINKKLKELKPLLVPLVFGFLGFLLNVFSPGNFIRTEQTSGMNPIKAILVSLHQGLSTCYSSWTTWAVMVGMILLIPLFAVAIKDFEFGFKYPAIVVLFGYGLTSALFTPAYFAVGNIAAGRINAVTYFVHILVLMLSVFYVTGWTIKRANIKIERVAFWPVIICAAVLFAGSVLDVIPEPDTYSYSSAATDLLNGNAATYHSEQKAWEETMRANKGADVELPNLSVEPGILYFSKIKPDESDWENSFVAQFYELNSVKTK